MPFTDAEKTRIRTALGYPSVSAASSMVAGGIVPIQTLFLVESAVDRILPDAEDTVRRYLTVMEDIECRMGSDALDRLAATRIDGLALNPKEMMALEREFQRWGHRLAEVLAVPVYPGSTKYQTIGGGIGSIPVRR